MSPKQRGFLEMMRRRLEKPLPSSKTPSEKHLAAKAWALDCGAREVEMMYDLVKASWGNTPPKEAVARMRKFGFSYLTDRPGFKELLGRGGWWFYDCPWPRDPHIKHIKTRKGWRTVKIRTSR
jgi:hypothetical protein